MVGEQYCIVSARLGYWFVLKTISAGQCNQSGDGGLRQQMPVPAVTGNEVRHFGHSLVQKTHLH